MKWDHTCEHMGICWMLREGLVNSAGGILEDFLPTLLGVHMGNPWLREGRRSLSPWSPGLLNILPQPDTLFLIPCNSTL